VAKKNGGLLDKALGVKMASKLSLFAIIALFWQNHFILVILFEGTARRKKRGEFGLDPPPKADRAKSPVTELPPGTLTGEATLIYGTL